MKSIEAKISLEDKEAAREILKHLKAPVTEANVKNLQVVISELGELYEEAYNTMLIKLANDKLASYDAKCPCGQRITVHLTAADLETWGNC
jgi:hypothetical protein